MTAGLVNRTWNDPRTVQLDIIGFPGAKATATILTSPDPQTGSAWDRPLPPRTLVI